jgi:tellurite resistance protein TerC
MRGIFIALGTAILEHFIWAFLLFGLVLLYAAYRMQFGQEKKFDPDKSFIVRLFRKVFPVSNKLDGDHFFTLENGKRAATVMLLTLIVIELTDVVFAFDSIPAIFAITTDPFIVFTSNIFAILGLRSLYFVLADIQGMFEYLKSGLAVILLFIAVKLILKPFHFEVPIMISLLVILTILLVSIFASVVHHRKRQRKETEISVEVDLPEFVQESRATHLAHEHAMHRTGSVHPHHARIAHAIPPSRPHPGTARAKPVMEPSTAKKKKRSRSR